MQHLPGYFEDIDDKCSYDTATECTWVLEYGGEYCQKCDPDAYFTVADWFEAKGDHSALPVSGNIDDDSYGEYGTIHCVETFTVPDLSADSSDSMEDEVCGFFDFFCEDGSNTNVVLSGAAVVALGLTLIN